VGHFLGIPEEHNACAPPVKAKATTAEEAEQNDTRSSDDEGERESSKRGSLVSDKDGEVNNEEDQIDPLDAFSGATAALETVVHYAFAPNDYSQQFAASVLGALGADGPLKAPLAHVSTFEKMRRRARQQYGKMQTLFYLFCFRLLFNYSRSFFCIPCFLKFISPSPSTTPGRTSCLATLWPTHSHCLALLRTRGAGPCPSS